MLISVFYLYVKSIYGTNAVLTMNISIKKLNISNEFLCIFINTKIIIVIIKLITNITFILYLILSSFDYTNP